MKKERKDHSKEEVLNKLERFQEGTHSKDDLRDIIVYFNDPRYSQALEEGLASLWENELSRNINGRIAPELESILDQLLRQIGDDQEDSTK